MADAPKPTARQKRLGKIERTRAEERFGTEKRPIQTDLPDHCVQVVFAAERGERETVLAGEVLFDLVAMGDEGVVKICPTKDGTWCFVYWRWTRGTWAGHYVGSLRPSNELGSCLLDVQRRYAEVVAGRRRPTKDRFN